MITATKTTLAAATWTLVGDYSADSQGRPKGVRVRHISSGVSDYIEIVIGGATAPAGGVLGDRIPTSEAAEFFDTVDGGGSGAIDYVWAKCASICDVLVTPFIR